MGRATKEVVSIDTASFVLYVETAHAQTRIMNRNIPHQGDFPTLIVNNLVNEKALRGIEFLDKIRILGASLRVVLSHEKYLLRKDSIMLFAPKEKGQGLVEYAIILALVAIVVIAVMRL